MRLLCLNVVPSLPHQIHAAPHFVSSDHDPWSTAWYSEPFAETVVGLLFIELSVNPSRLGPCVSQKPPTPM